MVDANMGEEHVYNLEVTEDFDSPITPFTMDVPLFGPIKVPTHQVQHCTRNHCPMHNPSNNPLASWPLHWRTERGIFERFCRHGISHPDPDDMAYQIRTKGKEVAEVLKIHNCDGCCGRRENDNG